jgi:hypothetical protein
MILILVIFGPFGSELHAAQFERILVKPVIHTRPEPAVNCGEDFLLGFIDSHTME